MFKTLIVVSCILAVSLATPLPEDAKKSDKRSVEAYHYPAATAISYHAAAPIAAAVPVATAAAAVPVATSAYSYTPHVAYSAPSFYSAGYPSYGYTGYSGYHGLAGHAFY